MNQIKNKLINNQESTEIYLIDSLISEDKDGNKSKFLFEYNFDDQIIARTGFFAQNGDWKIYMKDEYFYDSYNNLIREIYFDWNNAAWDSSLQIIYEYDQQYQLISRLIQLFSNNNWENVIRTNYTYDIAGNETTTLSEMWKNSQWNNSQIVYSYYSAGNIRDSLLLQLWMNDDWENYSRSSFYYNSITTYLELIISQLWSGNGWQDNVKLTITNDPGGNQLQNLVEIWNGSLWQNYYKLDFTYIWNYFESCYSEFWNGTDWEPGDYPISIINPDGFKLGLITQTIFIYYIIVGIYPDNIELPVSVSLSQNFPNPFNPITNIEFRIADLPDGKAGFGFVSLKVYDVLGNEIATLVNEEKPAGIYELEFNAVETSRDLSLPSGIYFYRLKAGSYIETKKMVLLR